jgi:hypothetical protein
MVQRLGLEGPFGKTAVSDIPNPAGPLADGLLQPSACCGSMLKILPVKIGRMTNCAKTVSLATDFNVGVGLKSTTLISPV